MSKPVAVDGDTQVKTSSKKHSSDTVSGGTGKWQLQTFVVTKGEKCTVGGKVLELSATAAWSYVGGTTGTENSPVKMADIPDSATLTAGSTKTKDTGRNVLVDGDEAAGSVDGANKITVSVSQKHLKTD